ncbi:hypothetical protein DL98DRAFT_43648 [Cadophora sp. DSE1049]|nr:hypothetical protein DL98DRAFT_43648 [Cadophora sp. DSE1049]
MEPQLKSHVSLSPALLFAASPSIKHCFLYLPPAHVPFPLWPYHVSPCYVCLLPLWRLHSLALARGCPL